jgi:hypothetical protein
MRLEIVMIEADVKREEDEENSDAESKRREWLREGEEAHSATIQIIFQRFLKTSRRQRN